MHEEMLQRQTTSTIHLLRDERDPVNHITEERVLEVPTDVSVEFNPITPPTVDESCDSGNDDSVP